MTEFAVSTSNEQSIFAALELSKNSWLLAIRVLHGRTDTVKASMLVSGTNC